MKFTLPDTAEGIQLHGDGTRYDTKPGGKIEVDNPAHVKYIKQSEWYKDGFLAGGSETVYFADSTQRSCECGLALWPWQSQCSRCARSNG